MLIGGIVFSILLGVMGMSELVAAERVSKTSRAAAPSHGAAMAKDRPRNRNDELTVQRRRRAQRGMTLIEILVVLVLIGIVLGIVGGNFIGKGEKAKADAAKIEIGQIGQTLDLYKLEIGRYPTRRKACRR